jgi:DNA (cytosine-5)-methyltransferase 1
MRELSLFSGAGGGLLASKYLLEWETLGYVEFNEYCQKIISQRIKDGLLDEAPIFTNIQAFNREGYAESYQGMVDVISGGFPCQDISSAGQCKGIEGERSGLWKEMAYTIRKVRPKYAFIENSPMLTIRGLNVVLYDLAEMGFDAKWGVLGAHHFGGSIPRDRIWIVAGASPKPWGLFHRGTNKKHRNMGNHISFGSQINRFLEELERERAKRKTQGKDNLPPYLCELGDDVAYELDELRCIGNGQVPIVAATAWNILSMED